jgi:hypothetical protein
LIPSPTLIHRIEQEVGAREGERFAFRQTGAFSMSGLRLTQELIAQLPNTRTEALAALEKHGASGDVSPDLLRLASIGWNDRPLATFTDVERLQLVEQAIARLDDISDPLLLGSARIVAETLPDYRAQYEQRLAPIAAWAAKHADEIDQEANV